MCKTIAYLLTWFPAGKQQGSESNPSHARVKGTIAICKHTIVLLHLLLTPLAVRAQIITTVAGGGPNNLPALSANIASPTSVAVDSAGNSYIAAANQIYKVTSAGQLILVAGNGFSGLGDGGPATSAQLRLPHGVWVDSSGNIFIADTINNRVREVVASTGNIQTVAGNGTAGFSGDGGAATSAQLNLPGGIFVDSSGNIFIADTNNQRVREVLASTGNINTVAGSGTQGFSGDGGAATSAALNKPGDVFVDRSGNIFIADTNNSRVREVAASTSKPWLGTAPQASPAMEDLRPPPS